MKRTIPGYKKKTAADILQQIVSGKTKTSKGAFISITNSDIPEPEKERLRGEVRKHFSLGVKKQDDDVVETEEEVSPLEQRMSNPDLVRIVLPSDVDARLRGESRVITLIRATANEKFRTLLVRLLEQTHAESKSLQDLLDEVVHIVRILDSDEAD